MVRKTPAADLKAKFRAVSRELRARWEGGRASGRHAGEKGLRSEGALREFLARQLPKLLSGEMRARYPKGLQTVGG